MSVREVSRRGLSLAVVLLIYAVGTTAARAQTYTDLFNFDGTNGKGPFYPQVLAQGRDGNLYGTTLYGGTSDEGVVFKITPGGSLTVLYNFDGGTDGNNPQGGLALGTDGSFYGTTINTIFRIAPTGSLTTLYTSTVDLITSPIQGTDGNFYGTTGAGNAYKITASGTFTALGALPGVSVGPLLQASDGNFYGTTWDGGGSNDGTIFKLTPQGLVTTVHAFDSTNGSSPFGPLIQATDGNFYGTTTQGGSRAGGVVFRLSPSGDIRILHDFGSESTPFAGLVQASDSNFYGVDYHYLFEITDAVAVSLLYNFHRPTGLAAWATPLQHTNGQIYGLTATGGTSDYGVVYSFDAGLTPFVKLLPVAGEAGRVIDILGQGFTGTTAVSFNGAVATFKVESDTYLSAIVPVGATSGVVTVVTLNGTLSSNQPFRVVSQ